ncbi:MAG: hypothetical protein JSS66_07510 [Armatimonadetes bacterium]|nr:hypothetical protein [Armatimonadota bacterium]
MNGAFEPQNVELFIVNYRRHKEVHNTVVNWLETFPFERINVIDNHGSLTLEVFREEDRDKIRILRTGRPDWMLGSLAECWNMAYCHTFPTRDWVVCSQDDVVVKHGWADCVEKSGFATLFAPKGDMIHVNSIDGFNFYGWWDERFRTIFYQESDYMLRCMKKLPEFVSVCDLHHWELRHNHIGLDSYFMASERTEEVLETGDRTATLTGEDIGQMWNSKWGRSPLEIFTQDREFPECAWVPAEVDWYPSVTHALKQSGRLQ